MIESKSSSIARIMTRRMNRTSETKIIVVPKDDILDGKAWDDDFITIKIREKGIREFRSTHFDFVPERRSIGREMTKLSFPVIVAKEGTELIAKDAVEDKEKERFVKLKAAWKLSEGLKDTIDELKKDWSTIFRLLIVWISDSVACCKLKACILPILFDEHHKAMNGAKEGRKEDLREG